MKLAINYSPQAAALLQQREIELDYFKTPPWPDMIAEAEKLRPVYVHFGFRAHDVGQPDWDEIEVFLERTSTKHINIHLGIKVDEMPEIPAKTQPNLKERQEVIDRLLTNVRKLTQHFGAEQIIAENIPFHPNQDYNLAVCADPELISEVVDRAGCGFLLDISHARIAAHYLGIEPQEYIERLPVKQLQEIHFTGIHDWDGTLTDHLSILETDWFWLEWVLEKVRSGEWGNAHLLAFEYGGTGKFFERFSDPAVMAAQVPKLYALCHNGHPTTTRSKPQNLA